MDEPQPGHNGQLKAIVERVERINEQIKEFRSDQKDIFAEAKSNGWDLKALRRVISLRAQDKTKRDEFENLVDTYMVALGDR